MHLQQIDHCMIQTNYYNEVINHDPPNWGPSQSVGTAIFGEDHAWTFNEHDNVMINNEQDVHSTSIAYMAKWTGWIK